MKKTERLPIPYTLFLIALYLLSALPMSAQDVASYYKASGASGLKAPELATFAPRRVELSAEKGAVPDGQTLCTEALQGAIDRLSQQGGGTLNVGPGIWLTAPIELKEGVCLSLEFGAVLLLTPDKSLHRAAGDKPYPGGRCRPGISANKCANIGLTGQGVVDGNGQVWRPVKRGKVSDDEWKQFLRLGGSVSPDGKMWLPQPIKGQQPIEADPKKEESRRADLVRFTDCKRVLLEGITIQNSPRFHLHPCQCEDLVIRGVTVRCPWNAQNGDGIDLSNCRRALIADCLVDVGDDGICMKSGTSKKAAEQGPCQDILVTHCTVRHAHGGFVLGSDCAGGHRDMLVTDCLFTGTDTGLRFKSAIGRGGRTDNIQIRNIVMTNIKEAAIIFECSYQDRPAVGAGSQSEAVPELAPEFQGIDIDRVTCRGARIGIKAAGIDGLNCVHDIRISNSTLLVTDTEQDIAPNCHIKLDKVKVQGIRD